MEKKQTLDRPDLMAVIKWIRLPNLLIVSLTLILIRYAVLAPVFREAGLPFLLDSVSFLSLVLLTCMVTLGGYLINDYYDQETDRINRVERRAISVWISEARALGIYLVLTLLGAVITVWLGWKEDRMEWIWIYPVAVGLLWWYSRSLKSGVLWGNLLVSAFCAAVTLLIPFAEKELLLSLPAGDHTLRLLYAYAVFAGLSNLLREVVKDAEDYEGDQRAGLRTLPVVFGMNASRVLALALAVLTAALLVWYALDSPGSVSLEGMWPFLVFCLLPLGAILVLLMKPSEQVNWSRLSLLCKLVMLGGLLALLLV